MVKTVLYAEKLYDNDKVEREVFGPDVRVVWRNVANLAQLEESDCERNSSEHATTLQQPFDRQARCDRHRGTAQQRAAGLFIVTDLLPVVALDPEQLAFLRQADLVRVLGHGAPERRLHLPGEVRAVDDESHFGIQPRRPRIEIE